jgi:MoxR-like ATPase
MVSDYVSWGAGPRASEYLILAAKAKALLSGSLHVTPEHIKQVALPVLRHRVLLNFSAEADQVQSEQVIEAMLRELPVDGAGSERKVLERVVR